MTSRSDSRRTSVPGAVRVAGAIVALQGAIGVGWGVFELVRGLSGVANRLGAYGIAFWILPLGAGVLAGGIGLLRGQRWGRTLGVLTNLLLGLAGANGVFSQGRPEIGLPMIAVSLVVLGILFSPQTVAWLEGEYGEPSK